MLCQRLEECKTFKLPRRTKRIQRYLAWAASRQSICSSPNKVLINHRRKLQLRVLVWCPDFSSFEASGFHFSLHVASIYQEVQHCLSLHYVTSLPPLSANLSRYPFIFLWLCPELSSKPCIINPVHTNRRRLYLNPQYVPRCKHSSSGL